MEYMNLRQEVIIIKNISTVVDFSYQILTESNAIALSNDAR